MIHERASGSFELDRAKKRKPFSALVGPEEAADHCCIPTELLTKWTESGHAPFYTIGGEGPFYKKGEIREWVDDALVVHHKGFPLPRRVEVIVAAGDSENIPIPFALAAIPGLCRVSLYGTCSGIYFLCDKKTIVYVGQSNNVLARICGHIGASKKKFDHTHCFYLPCPLDRLEEVEERFIALLKPLYNRSRSGKHKR